jgi:hypothetical protein
MFMVRSQQALSDLYEVDDDFVLHDDYDEEDDNAIEANSPRGGYTTDDKTAASFITDVNLVRESPLVSSPTSHPKQEPIDPTSPKKTDLACLIEQNANLDNTQKIGLFDTLIKYLKYMCTKPGKCN